MKSAKNTPPFTALSHKEPSAPVLVAGLCVVQIPNPHGPEHWAIRTQESGGPHGHLSQSILKGVSGACAANPVPPVQTKTSWFQKLLAVLRKRIVVILDMSSFAPKHTNSAFRVEAPDTSQVSCYSKWEAWWILPLNSKLARWVKIPTVPWWTSSLYESLCEQNKTVYKQIPLVLTHGHICYFLIKSFQHMFLKPTSSI